MNQHPLGKPINRPEDQPKPEDPGKWVPAATPGYYVHTKTKAVADENNIPFHERPWHKPATLKADDSATCAVPSSLDVTDARWRAVARLTEAGSVQRTDEVLIKFGGMSPVPWCCDIPADRRADVIRALNQLGR